MWVAIHMYMEATLGISLNNCLYLILAKMLYLSYYLSCFIFNKICYKRMEQVLPGSGMGLGKCRPNNVYTYEQI
jgi:hypothetical protein